MDSWKGTKLEFICSIRGTVIRNVWPEILILAVYTTGVLCFHNYAYELEKKFPTSLLPVLGTVTGLLIVFRTNTAYDRYWEGRKLWSTITHTIRTFTRNVWVSVQEDKPEDIVEKLTVINLLVAFPYAVKNYLRDDHSYESKDIRELIRPLPRTGARPAGGVQGHVNNDFLQVPPLLGTESGKHEPVLLGVNVVLSGSGQNLRASCRRDKWRAHAAATETNIPTEILLYVSTYVHRLAKNDAVPFIYSSPMNSGLAALSDTLSGLERILQTPIPFAYAVHLEHVVWLYLITLPYQIVQVLNWWTIPAVTLASFCLLGILDIGAEIENPFGTDYNDLPLEEICDRIKRDAYITVGSYLADPTTWMISSENHPLFPMASENAEKLSLKTTEELHALLATRAENISHLFPE